MTTLPNHPPVLKWYRFYSILMTVLYLGLFVLLFLGLAYDNEIMAEANMPGWFYYAYLFILFGITAVLGGGFLASFFIPVKPWAWIYHLALICIGLTSPCCMPVSIPLLIFWIQDETKGYFGR